MKDSNLTKRKGSVIVTQEDQLLKQRGSGTITKEDKLLESRGSVAITEILSSEVVELIELFSGSFGNETTNKALINALNLELVERKKPIPPEKAPMLYRDYLDGFENKFDKRKLNPWAFIQKYYGDFLQDNVLYQEDVNRVDPYLRKRFSHWANQNKKEAKKLVPTKSIRDELSLLNATEEQKKKIQRECGALYRAKKRLNKKVNPI